MTRPVTHVIPTLILAIAGCASQPATTPKPTAAMPAATSAPKANPYTGLSSTERDRALIAAVTDDDVDAARQLIQAGADPDTLDDRHDTAWLVTGVTGSVPMAKVILAAKPDLAIENRFGGLSIIPASERGHADYVEYVVEHTGIDIDHVNDLGWTALLEAVILGEGSARWQRVVRALVDAGADVSIRDPLGMTALDHARSLGFDGIVRILEGG